MSEDADRFERPLPADDLVAMGRERYAGRKHLGEHTAASLAYESSDEAMQLRRQGIRIMTDAAKEAAQHVVDVHAPPPPAPAEEWHPVSLDDTDIAASAESAALGRSPTKDLRDTAPAWQPPLVIPPADDRVTLHGEQLAAHLALQDAAKALKNAQASVVAAQDVFRDALARWCRASEG